MEKKEALELISEEMKLYKNMAKRSALDALTGSVRDKENEEAAALKLHSTWLGLKLAHDLLANHW